MAMSWTWWFENTWRTSPMDARTRRLRRSRSRSHAASSSSGHTAGIPTAKAAMNSAASSSRFGVPMSSARNPEIPPPSMAPMAPPPMTSG